MHACLMWYWISFPHDAAMCDRQLLQLTLRQVLCMVDCDWKGGRLQASSKWPQEITAQDNKNNIRLITTMHRQKKLNIALQTYSIYRHNLRTPHCQCCHCHWRLKVWKAGKEVVLLKHCCTHCMHTHSCYRYALYIHTLAVPPGGTTVTETLR